MSEWRGSAGASQEPSRAEPGRAARSYSADGRNGASPSFISALPRPTPDALAAAKENNPDCPVCLQALAAIETEEEYALASEHYFGDVKALGLRVLPCKGAHVVCARCCAAWLRIVSAPT